MNTEQPCNLATLRGDPDALVTINDLVQAKIIGGHQAAKRWIAKGWLPSPTRLPNGQLRWRAGAVVEALGLLDEPQSAAE